MKNRNGMMTEKWKKTLVGSLLVSAITACSNMPNSATFYPETDYIHVYAKGIECHLCLQHTKWNYGTYAVLQSAAEATLKSGHKLFSIEDPDILAESTINTLEEFVERCSVHAGHMLAQNNNPCKIGKSVSSRRKRDMLIKVYNHPPLERLTFNAEKVLEKMKTLDLYEPDHTLGKYIEK